MPLHRKKYLFIRILEACNADCFMCGYALSRDRYRFSLSEFRGLLPGAHKAGVRFVRFTGGEPLLHRDLLEMVCAGSSAGMKMSLITNGSILPRRIDRLASGGLTQVIVSIDGAIAENHDRYRKHAWSLRKLHKWPADGCRKRCDDARQYRRWTPQLHRDAASAASSH